MSTTKAVWIEWRAPKTKEETKLFGQTTFDNNSTARLFLNTCKNKKTKALVMTYWHEMAHAFFAFHKSSKKLSPQMEEMLCQKLEQVIWEIIR